ncbi:MAG: MerR family DNA-binding protein [Acidobacteria bacterium]|nr:MerR family DNA-binding protein [Acidobacteriota bacterium]
MKSWTSGALARNAGVNIETVRYYERRGLLPKPPRTQSGYRLFSDDAVRRLRFIKRAQQIGFSLKEVKELLGLQINPRTMCADVKRRAEVKAADIESKVRDLEAMRKALVKLAAACSGRGPATQCPILESLDHL